MQIALGIAVILLAVLVGAAVPVLVQMRSTLRSAQEVLDRVGPKLERALGEATEAADRLNRMASEFEERARKAKPLFDAASDLGEHLTRLRGSLATAVTLGSTLGPALAAAVKAFVTRKDGNAADPGASGKEAQP